MNQLRAGTIVPIGGSLIHHEPTAKNPTVPEPIWWQVCDSELGENYSGWPRPEGHPWRMYSKAQKKYAYQAPPKRLVKVQPGQKYRLQFWCRATVANTRMSIEIRDQNGAYAVKSGSVKGTVNSGNYKTAKEAKQPWPVTDFSDSSVGGYLVGFFTVPTETTKVVSTIEFKEGVEYVYLDVFRFNLLDGAQGNLWIAGLSLELDIPDQAQIDALQTKQISDSADRIRQIEEVNRANKEQTDYVQDMTIAAISMLSKKIFNIESRRVGFHLFDGNGSSEMVSRPSYGKVVASGDWVGKLVWIRWGNPNYDGYVISSGMEEVGAKREFSVVSDYRDPILVLWERYPMRMEERSRVPSNASWDAPRGQYTDVPGMTVTVPPGATRLDFNVTVAFTNVNRGSTYGLRVNVGGKAYGQWSSNRFGPLGPLGERTWSSKISGSCDVKPGQSVAVQVYSYAPNSSQRRVLKTGSRAEFTFYVET